MHELEDNKDDVMSAEGLRAIILLIAIETVRRTIIQL
jgi:hypothetical protein